MFAYAQESILIVGVLGGAFLLLNVAAAILFYIYGSQKEDTPLKRKIHAVIYQIDQAADHLSDPLKRAQAIMQVQQLLAWRRIFLPSPVIGYVIDTEVYLIHKLGCPNLHDESKMDQAQQDGQSDNMRV